MEGLSDSLLSMLVLLGSCYVSLMTPVSSEHTALFVFGDSLFDGGNNLNSSRAPQHWPYGETFFHHPTGRISDGRIVPDFIAEFANMPLLSPYLRSGAHQWTNGSNFAVGGAAVLDQNHFGTINLRTQLSYFKIVEKKLRENLGDVEAKKLLNRAVYLFSIGGNDYFGFNSNGSQSSRRNYVGTVIGNLTIVLKEIYKIGGRKIAFQNVGPLSCVPTVRAMNAKLGYGCSEEPLATAKLHNIALSKTLQKMGNHLPGFKYSIFNYFNSLTERINNPSKFGFKEGKGACCGSGPYRSQNCGGQGGTIKYELCSNPNEYVWWNGAHTTEAANRQMAQLIWSGNPKVTAPYNVKQLFEFA